MNPEQITQIVEAIKTLNININDATTQKIADAILPVVKMYLMKEYFDMFLGYITLVLLGYMLYKIAKLALNKKRNDND